MNDESPAGRGSRRRPGGMHSEGSAPGGRLAELDRLLDVRERLVHAIDELEAGEAGIDPARALLEGLLADFDLEQEQA